MKMTQYGKNRAAAMLLAILIVLSMAPSALAETFSAIVTARSMTVYEDARLSREADKLEKGAIVRITAYQGKAARIRYSGHTGYAKVADMKAVETVAAKAVTNADTLVYQYPTETSKSAQLKQGVRLYVLSWSDDWARVEKDGVDGYVKLTSLTKADDDWQTEVTGAAPTKAPDAAQKGVVTAETLPVYQRPDAKSKKLGTMKQGQSVNVLKWNEKWAYVELNGKFGYCLVRGLGKGESSAVTPAASPAPTTTTLPSDLPHGMVKSDTLKVYKTASAKADTVLKLKKGDIVDVIKWNDKWAYIEVDGVYGFCSVSGLARTDQAPTAAPSPTPSLDNAVKATVSQENVSVYKLAGDSSSVIGSLMWGETVNIISVSDGWAYIEKSGNYGFCQANALTKEESNTGALPKGYKKGGFTATVIAPGAKTYAEASTEGEGEAAALGASVEVLGYSQNQEWAYIAKGADRAYIPVKHLSITSYETIGSQGSELLTLLKALLSYGYYDGIPSGTADSGSVTAAIKRFQAACGLEQSGFADQTVQRILYAGYAPASPLLSESLSSGDKGDSVTRIQLRLYALGYLGKSTSLDGSYGDTTTAAINLFQKQNGLEATGTANAATLKKLYSASAAAKPAGIQAADSESASGGSVVNPSGTVKLSSTYVTTMPSELKSNTSKYSSGMSNAQKLEHVIYSAQAKLGCTYVYGATGPNTFDCSGLTQYSFKQVSVSLQRTAYSQGYDTAYDKISSVGSLKRGDLVFFNTISDSDLCDHVGIYLGGGCFIHASSGGHKVVVSNITSGYYNRVFSWGRRILK